MVRIKDGNGPNPRFPAGNSSIREWGRGQFLLYGDSNGRKTIPVGVGGDGDGSLSPNHDPRIPAPLAAVGANQQVKAHLRAQPQATSIYAASLRVTLKLSIHPFLRYQPAAAARFCLSSLAVPHQTRRDSAEAGAPTQHRQQRPRLRFAPLISRTRDQTRLRRGIPASESALVVCVLRERWRLKSSLLEC